MRTFKRAVIVEAQVPVIQTGLTEETRRTITPKQHAEAIKQAGVEPRDVTNVRVLWIQEET